MIRARRDKIMLFHVLANRMCFRG